MVGEAGNGQELLDQLPTVAADVVLLDLNMPVLDGLGLLEKLLLQESCNLAPAFGVPLTHREREILQLVASGLTNQQIADQLHTGKRTVESHRQNLLDKTGASNTAALVKYAMENGLLQL